MAMISSILYHLAIFILFAWRSSAEITFEYIPIENIVQNHLRNADTSMKIRNITASASSCYALFSDGHSIGTSHPKSKTRIDKSHEYLIPNQGVVLSTGKPFLTTQTTINQREDTGESDLQAQIYDNAAVDIFDPCFIQFELSCPIDAGRYTTNIDVRYVFGSEEYSSMNDQDIPDNESDYAPYHNNDAFGIFLNDQNIALVPQRDATTNNSNKNNGQTKRGILPVTIDNINSKVNSELFVPNVYHFGIGAGGYTTELRASGQVFPGWNSIKFVIGDASDRHFDSWVYLKARSLSCTQLLVGRAEEDGVESSEIIPTKDNPFDDTNNEDNTSLGEDPTNRERTDEAEDGVIVKSRVQIPMSMAVGLLVLLGILALAMPLIGLSFCDKKQSCGCGRNGKRYGKAVIVPAAIEQA